MAANSYYHGHGHGHAQQHQHLLSPSLSSPSFSSGGSSGPSSPLKQLHLVNPNAGYHDDQHQLLDDFEPVKSAHLEDERIKAKIRRLRLISRILGFAISVGVFVPISMTVQKFVTTQNVYHDVTLPNGSVESRTAWHKDSKVWPTWMYFLVAAISVLLNLVIILSYVFCGIKRANKAATIASVFSWVVMIGNLVVWSVAASLYRLEKDKNGKSNDLWGWTCSPAAREIQKEFAGEVDFNHYCNVQSVSFYVGLAQVASAVLTIVTYIFVIVRQRTKKNVMEQKRMTGFVAVSKY